MSLTTKEKSVIIGNIVELSKLFNIQHEKTFLEQCFSSDEINECLTAGETLTEQTLSFCMKLITRKDVYVSLKEHFLLRSKDYKSFYDKMMDENSPLNECSDTFNNKKEDIMIKKEFETLTTRINEILQEIRKLKKTSVHMDPTPNEINKNVTKQEDLLNLQRRINELEEERRHWLFQMTCESNASTRLEEIYNEINIVKERCQHIHEDSLKMDSLHGATDAILLVSLNNMPTKDKDAESLLQTAIKQGNSLLVEKLLQQSPALINMKDKDGLYPIQIAINAENWIVSKILLKYNATNVDRKWAETTLRDAARNGKLEIVEIILQIFPDLIQVKDDYNQTLLHYAAYYGHLDIVEKLLEISPDLIHVTSNDGGTCVHSASWNGHLKIVEKLLEISPDLIHVTRNDGWTCLHSTSFNGHLEIVEKLLEISPDLINVTKNDGWTCLHLASRNGHLKIVEVLLRRGANPNLRDEKNRTPRDVAIRYKKTEVAKILQLAENNPRR